MVCPNMDSGVEQRNNILIGVQKSSEVAAFTLIAMRTGIGKIFRFIAPAVFQADNMVYFKGKECRSDKRQYSH